MGPNHIKQEPQRNHGTQRILRSGSKAEDRGDARYCISSLSGSTGHLINSFLEPETSAIAYLDHPLNQTCGRMLHNIM